MTIDTILQVLVFPALAMIWAKLDKVGERITRLEVEQKTLAHRVDKMEASMKLVAISLLAVSLVGCVGIPVYQDGTPKGNALVVPVTNSVPVISDHVLEEVVIEETQLGTTTNVITRTVKVTNLVDVVSYVANPTLKQGLQTAKEVTGWLPEPIGAVSNIVLSVLSLGLTGYAGYMSRKAKLLNPVIAGVEKRGDTETKKEIQALAIASGLEAGLNAIVNKVTKGKRV